MKDETYPTGDDGHPSLGGDGLGYATAPLDPIYAWGIVLEPVEVLIARTSDFIVELAKESYQRGEPFSDEELEDLKSRGVI